MNDRPDSSADSPRDSKESREAPPEENHRCAICGVPEGAPHIKSMHERDKR
jgi:hypothetical protein